MKVLSIFLIFSIDALNKLVYEQFLDSDLVAIGKPVFQADIAKIKDQIFEGTFVLQIQEFRDISQPQTEEIADEKEEVVKIQNSKFRTLRLEVTDGTQKFYCLEFENCPQLSSDVKVGCKIRIKDPHVKRGMMMLNPKKLEVLGGEFMKGV